MRLVTASRIQRLSAALGATLMVLLGGCATARGNSARGAVLPRELAGKYFKGGWISNLIDLEIRGDGTFCAEVGSDIGRLSSGCGNVETHDSHFRFRTDSGMLPQLSPGAWVQVRWGARRYLVPEDKLLEFVNAVNAGEEPREDENGYYFFRAGDSRRPATGAPNLPGKWALYVLPGRAVGRVARVNDGGDAEVEFGTVVRVRPGMEFFTRCEGEGWCMLVVKSVAGPSIVMSRADPEDSPLVVGQEVVSRFE